MESGTLKFETEQILSCHAADQTKAVEKEVEKEKSESFKTRVAVQAITCNKLQKSIGQQASLCREGEVVTKAEAALMQS